jgi:hypothetical protein
VLAGICFLFEGMDDELFSPFWALKNLIKLLVIDGFIYLQQTTDTDFFCFFSDNLQQSLNIEQFEMSWSHYVTVSLAHIFDF